MFQIILPEIKKMYFIEIYLHPNFFYPNTFKDLQDMRTFAADFTLAFNILYL